MLHRAIDNSRKVLAGIAAMVAILVLTIGCDKERMCRVPTGNATCQIDPNSALYPGLNNCDGYEYLVGGYNGIVVIRTSWNDFVAYERSCPLDSAILDVPEGSEIWCWNALVAAPVSAPLPTAHHWKEAELPVCCMNTTPITTVAHYI